MNLFPLVLREFNVANRRPTTRKLWLWFGGGSMLASIWSLLVSNGDSAGAIFRFLTAMAVVLGMVVALYAGSDSIARERREGTLGFLFLTDLTAWDVALGKFSAIGLVPVYTLLGMFPAFALCQLMGGVSAGLFGKVMLALLTAWCFSIAAALYISSRCEDHRKAFGGTAGVLLVANPLWLWYAAAEHHTASFLALWLSSVIVAGLFLRGATTGLKKVWRNQEVTTKQERLATPGKAARSLLERKPVGWMMLRRYGSRIWTERAAVLTAICGLALLLGARLVALELILWLLLAVHLLYLIVMLTRTAYAFYSDRRSGALELLLGTPLADEEIFMGLNHFLVRKSLLAAWLLTGIDIVLAGFFVGWRAYPLAALPLALGAGLWITLWGLGWVGVYRSLMMKHPSLAVPATFARLSFVPVLLSLLFLAAPTTDLGKVATFYVLATGFLAAFFSMDAKQALIKHGRTLLLRPENEKAPHIENEWTFIDWQADENTDSGTIPSEILAQNHLQENPYSGSYGAVMRLEGKPD